ncbi:MAG: protein kinase, partial [Candidatus Promineifilaceae bacterium]|nr:protein kinase [Candidatus Promineifilaceae bacterium]
MLRVHLFGSPRFERDGQPLTIPRRKAVALAVYLLVTGQPQSRDTLAAMFWPEHDQSSARANLRRDLSRLKSALGGDIVQSEREQLSIVPDAQVWLDVAAFLEAQEQVAEHRHPPGRDCPDCVAAWSAAVELATDEFMAGFSLDDCPKFDEWQFYQAETLRRALAQMLQQLIDSHVGRGDFDPAIGYARRWLALDPLHEPAQRQLMRLYAWAGQQAAALRQYQEARRLLEEELGVEPEEASQLLYEAIRTRQLVPPATVASAPADVRYDVETLLASGGHGQLYLGRDRLTGKAVVLKRLKPELLQHDPAFVTRFKQEGDVLRQLAHPNIVQMLDLLEDEQAHTIVMEYVSGGSLRERLDEAGPLAVEEALDIALELADALSRAHHLGIIHRDLKPANVLLADDGTPRLTDFGLARLTREDVHLTRTGTLLGSPVYMSPEALRGETLDARSDIWSFGILLYEMLAGRSPFEGQQLTPVMLSILHDPLPDIEQYRPDLPAALVDLLRRMLVKDQARRLTSMRRVAAELEAIRAGRSLHTLDYLTPPPQRPEPANGAPARPMFLTMSVPEREGARSERVVGREPELALLEQALAEARRGRGQIVFVAGEGGRGKTTLMNELARLGLANDDDLLVASGACTVYAGLGDPYLPFRDAFELLCGQVEEPWAAGTITQEQATRLWTFAPQIIRLILERGSDMLDTLISQRAVAQRLEHHAEAGAATAEQLAAVVAQRAVRGASLEASQLFEQVADVLQALTTHHPLLLLIDDLQWVDGASAQLLFHLGLRMSGSRLLIVGAYRPSEVAVGRGGQTIHPLKPVLTELQRRFGQLVLDLGTTSPERGRAFVDALVDSEPNRLGSDFRQDLFQRTGGHALFTVELLRHMQEQGSLVQNAEDGWELCTDFDWSVLPARVEAVIARRFEHLNAEQQALLTVASVEGETFTAQVLAEVQRLPERALLQELARVLGEQYRLVYEQGEFLVGERYLTRYQFRHALVQQYVYDRLSQGERRLLHNEVGLALEKLYADDLEAVFVQLAHHFRQAGRTGKAIDYLAQAGHRARAKIALQQAARHYEAALAIWTKADDARVRGAILRRLGETLWVLGRLDEALAAFQNGYEVFAELGDLEQAGAVQQRIGRLYWERAERQTALTYYRQALETLAGESDSIELARARSAMAQMHMLASEFTEALVWGEQALELARRIDA